MRPGQFLSATIWLLVIIATAGTAAAQAPFAGTWKLNQDKSQLAGDTMKFGPAQGDAIELKAGGLTYSFRAGRQELRHALGQFRHLETEQPHQLDHRVPKGRRQAAEQG